MAFHEYLFPPRISANMQAGPRFMVDSAFTLGGQRYTNLRDPYPLHEYRINHPVRSGAEFEELRAFFWVVNGRDAFRFKDWSDYLLNSGNSSLELITGSTYQITRKYVSPGRTALRPIYKPVAGIKVFRNRAGVITDITSTSTITTTNGRVVLTGHTSGDTYYCTGEFHVPGAFTDPEAVFNVLGGSSMLTEWADFGVREVREIA
jgi:uncharacterized protein (TIGR02217 family)